ncbi:MAG TPA: hypothetical protein VEN30_32500 [Paraburkholderia sp.]|nr:hypothetical protein [Paraburkholderia sp.]
MNQSFFNLYTHDFARAAITVPMTPGYTIHAYTVFKGKVRPGEGDH